MAIVAMGFITIIVVVVDRNHDDDHLDEISLRKLPFLDVVGTGTREGELRWVQAQRADGLLVIGQGDASLARLQVPHADCLVLAAAG